MSFPLTRHSVVVAARSEDGDVRRRAFEALAAAYWKPVYKYLRLQWRAAPEDAEDLTQGFFARALEKEFFVRFDPARARFRTFLRACLDGYVANERKAARRLKRGGGRKEVPLDAPEAEGELRRQPLVPGADMEEYFHREWVRAVFGLAVQALRRQCEAAGKQKAFAVFERYDLAPGEGDARPTYAQLGQDLALPTTQVTNHLSAMRRQFRALVLETLAEQCATDEEFQAEARDLLGVETARGKRP
jgi:RNA polymerase sigma factor (sigma-70 family)